MGNNKKPQNNSRREFFSRFISGANSSPETEKVKMLTADGKLVEIDKKILEQASNKNKSSNKEIYKWMKNPSKNDE